jgi:hypothetical protein
VEFAEQTPESNGVAVWSSTATNTARTTDQVIASEAKQSPS